MMFKYCVGALLFVFMLHVGCPKAHADTFREQVLPFLQTYCVKCHNQKTAEGELNLTRFTSAALVARGPIISIQTLNEFTLVARRKWGCDWSMIGELVETSINISKARATDKRRNVSIFSPLPINM